MGYESIGVRHINGRQAEAKEGIQEPLRRKQFSVAERPQSEASSAKGFSPRVNMAASVGARSQVVQRDYRQRNHYRRQERRGESMVAPDRMGQVFSGVECEDLLQSIRQPDPDVEEERKQEPVEAAIWQAMEDIAVASQKSIAESRIMVRMHAIRTEKDQVRHEPLQPYWDEKSVRRRCNPWHQMSMCFARTEREHTWTSPQYRFNRRQC